MIIDDAINKYFQMADRFELLSFQREKELSNIIRTFKGGKLKQLAREELMCHNLKLVIKLAYSYYNNGSAFKDVGDSKISIMDIISAGNVGLLKAVDLYNAEEFKTRFSTYATTWIRQGISSFLHSTNSIVHIPTHIREGSKKYKDISKNKTTSDKDMMKILEVSEKGLNRIRKSNIYSFSMDIPVSNDKSNNGDAMTYANFIPDIKQISPDEEAARNNSSEIIRDVMNILDPVSKDIIEGQYLSSQKVRLKDLGKKYKISGERVRQIKEKALNKMRRELKKRTLTSF